jgi:NADH-quinone oxidoreductase subunit J
MEFLIFSAFAVVSVSAALLMVLQRNAMYSALFLILIFFCLAVFYILLGAYFLAVVQVAVYAGAIMVLMLFVIMLLNVAYPEPIDRVLGLLRPIGWSAALVLASLLAWVAAGSPGAPTPPVITGSGMALGTVGVAEAGHVQEVAVALFSKYLLPFEMTSILLLAAILGASVLARKRPDHA